MTDRGNSEIDQECCATEPNNSQEDFVGFNQDTQTDRNGERLDEDADSIADDGQDCATSTEHERAGNRKHYRRSGNSDNDEREGDEREEVLQWNHESSVSGRRSSRA